MTLRRELWQRALAKARRLELEESNRGARARLALADVLRRCGYEVSLVTIHSWSREAQGQAYLWAIAFLEGREDLPAPTHVAKGYKWTHGLRQTSGIR